MTMKMNKKGISLLEVVVSVGILATLVTSLATVYINSLSLNRLTYEKTIAVAAAESMLQQIRTYAYDDFENAIKRYDADPSNDPNGENSSDWAFSYEEGSSTYNCGTFHANNFAILDADGSATLRPIKINGVGQPHGEIIMANINGIFSETPNEALYGSDLANGFAVGIDLNGNGTTTDSPAYSKDLNFNGDTADANVPTADLKILPVIIRVTWMFQDEPMQIVVRSFITKNL